MSILKVARIGHPVIRNAARTVETGSISSSGFQKLLDDMVETMREYDGVGLAAPQIHVPLRVAVIEIPAADERGKGGVPLTVLVNPTVTPLDSREIVGWEGCLSIPDLRGQVPRYQKVRLEALDRQGRPFAAEAADFFARVIQHECDHLDGSVYVDRMRDMKSLAFLSEFERFVLAAHGDPA
jgi:peptide deformylase